MERNESATSLLHNYQDADTLSPTLPAGSPTDITPLSKTPTNNPPLPLLPVSPTSTLSPSSLSDSPHTFDIAYPALPSMPARDLPHFHKGAQIALENILDDYLRNADMSLLEVLSDLEDKKPVVGGVREDWERRVVLEGAQWVVEAVRAWWVDFIGEDDGADREAADREEDGRIDHMEVEEDGYAPSARRDLWGGSGGEDP